MYDVHFVATHFFASRCCYNLHSGSLNNRHVLWAKWDKLTTASTAGELSPTTSREGHLDDKKETVSDQSAVGRAKIFLGMQWFQHSRQRVGFYCFLYQNSLQGSDVASRDWPLNFQIVPAVRRNKSFSECDLKKKKSKSFYSTYHSKSVLPPGCPRHRIKGLLTVHRPWQRAAGWTGSCCSGCGGGTSPPGPGCGGSPPAVSSNAHTHTHIKNLSNTQRPPSGGVRSVQSKAETRSPYLSKEVADDEVGQVVSQAAELRGRREKWQVNVRFFGGRHGFFFAWW